ncbi:hypothetical protein HDU97_003527 [Phlyctochytrium planicorne]|nr:hypothetical protein HDU97_003527 [Phlyctochytrium planicorne]
MPPKKFSSSSSSSSSSKPSSAKDDKKDGKKKGGEPAPPPLFVPEPGQKLTREQHAILRAQRAKAAEEEKRALYYWASLEVIRKASSPEEQQFDYAPDPFAALELQAKLAAEKEKAEKDARERAEKQLEKLSKPWEEFQAVKISKEMEHMVDDTLRSLEEVQTPQVSGAVEDKDQILAAVVKLGFPKKHVEECVEYCNSVEASIEWLCRYIPEDDLPPMFAPKKETNMISSLSAANADAQIRDKIIKNMQKSGFNKRVCAEALRLVGWNEVQAITLVSRKLSGKDSVQEGDTDVEALQEELLVLESIFDSRVSISTMDAEGQTIRIQSERFSDISLEFYIDSKSNYPTCPPGMLVDADPEKYSAFQRLGILKRLCEESAQKSGEPMIFDLLSWMEDNVESILENLPTLRSLAVSDIFNQSESDDAPVLSVNKSASPSKRTARPKNAKMISNKDAEEIQAKLESIEQSKDFQDMLKFRKKLPSFNYRERILEVLNSSPVLILCGETGCGKSTQTGQFILENEVKHLRGGTCNIICTQPRRISALSLAERVAAERGEDVGQTVGYTVRGETKKSKGTRLTFCTAGVLLRMLQSDPSLEGVTHVIIDEVHERSVDSDFLLVILKELLNRKKGALSLILMSATINSETFSNYFNSAPVLNIPGFTHPVKDLYLEDIFSTTKYVPDTVGRPLAKPTDEEADRRTAMYTNMGLDLKAIRYLLREGLHEPIDNYLIAAIVRNICSSDDQGAILIFLQGAMEIDRCIRVLETECQNLNLDLYPLHAGLSPKQQSAVFRRPKKGCRKVVVSTNVAETKMRYEGTMMALTETLASAASCRQRRGRAGRVRPGFCYKLFSKNLETAVMPAHTVPEILRVPLEQLCLTLKAMGIHNVLSFLSKAVDPPPVDNIKLAIDDLKSLNAINVESEELTALGQHLAAIPADVRVAKMLIFGAIFHCLDPILTISAMMSTKSPFVAGGQKREEAKAARKTFAWDRSDWLTDCKAYDAWVAAKSKGKSSEMEFCDKYFLSSVTLMTISDLRRQYLDILEDLGFIHSTKGGISAKWNENATDSRLIKAAIVAGLYPRVVIIKPPDTRYIETAYGAMPKEAEAQEIKFFEPGNSRVFIHPASVNFAATKYEDLLMVWPILMLGGKLTIDHEGRTVEVDGFTKFQAFPRIAVLVNGLRRLLDVELAKKIENPGFDIASTQVGKCIIRLMAKDGL